MADGSLSRVYRDPQLDNRPKGAYFKKQAGPQVQQSALGGQKQPVAGRGHPSLLEMLVPIGLELPNIEVDAWLRQHGRPYQRLAVRRAPDLGARRVSDPLSPQTHLAHLQLAAARR